MSRIRVLIVDDAAVIRRAVADELAADPALEVVGTAANGKIALARLPQVCPDLVILDIEMPEMDGLATLREIRKLYPRLPVIMFSSLTERGATATLDALALGATDYFTKPSNSAGLQDSLQVIREELIPEIKALCPRSPAPAAIGLSGLHATLPPPVPPASSHPSALHAGLAPPALPTTPVAPALPRSPTRPVPIDVVAIGTSTGGPNALADVFAGLPADLPVPIVIAQHMPPMFTRLLAERLSNQYSLQVEEGRAGGLLRPGHAWVAPGDFHMVVVRNGLHVKLLTHKDPPENSCRPSVDVLLRSIAQVFGPASLAVVLTGMGQDGLRGCEAVKAAGGQVLVQDQPTSVVWGMPGAVSRAGLADRVLPLSQIAPEIVRRVKSGRGNGR